jgi:hypothetical protein
MQIVSKSIAGTKVVFESILDEVPGGVSLKVDRLDNLTVNANVDKRFLPAGTPVYVDLAARTADVCKSAIALTGSTAQALRVPKNNHYKVGDLINDGVTSSEITAITTSVAGYDTIATAEALIYAEGTKYGEGSASGTSAVLLYTPNGMTKDNVWIGDGNADSAIVKMGTVRADALTFPINALYAVALRGGTAGTGTSLITLV